MFVLFVVQASLAIFAFHRVISVIVTKEKTLPVIN
jgi:hypothetical protein